MIIMAFQPVRLTDPKGNREDVIATHPVDLTNFQYRDGYVISENQDNLSPEDETGETASTVAGIRTLDQTGMTQAQIDASKADAEKADSGDAVASEKASTSNTTARPAAAKPSTSGAKSGTEGKATDAGGNTVQTA